MDISTENSSSPIGGQHSSSHVLIVKVSGGATFTVQVPPAATIGDIKGLAESGSKIPKFAQRMFYKGKLLSDNDTLKGIPASATLFLVRHSGAVKSSEAVEVASQASSDPPIACLGSCGFYGAPALEGYCSKCHKAKKELAAAEVANALKQQEQAKAEDEKEIHMEDREDQTEKNKCWECSKKIGLTGVRCRCGYFFCPNHRYAESHHCDYDYKANERRKLTKQNPVVQANKLSEKA